MAGPTQATARPAAPAAPAEPAASPADGKLRIYLFMSGEGERDLALDFLTKHKDDEDSDDPSAPITIQKTSEILLSDLNRDCVIIPVIRNINRDRRVTQNVEGADDKIRFVEQKAPVFECNPVVVADFLERVADATGRNRRDTLDENALVNAVNRVLHAPGSKHALACARIDPRSDGHMRTYNWLVLRWG